MRSAWCVCDVQEMISRLDRVIASRKNNGEKREMKVEEARPIIEDLVSERLISDDAVSLRLLLYALSSLIGA